MSRRNQLTGKHMRTLAIMSSIEAGPGCKFPGGYVLLQREWRDLRATAEAELGELLGAAVAARERLAATEARTRRYCLQNRLQELRALQADLVAVADDAYLMPLVVKRVERLEKALKGQGEDDE